MPQIQFNREQKRNIRKTLESAGLSSGMQARTLGAVRIEGEKEDPKTETLRWILTTEMPATVFDWNRWDFVEEVLLMDGMLLPANRQIPFLDSHSRSSVDDLLGSVTDFELAEVDGFSAFEGAVAFAADEKSQRTKQKAIDGHLTDGSVGYEVLKSVWIPEDEEAAVNGRIFQGPLKVTYQWMLKEFSGTPIGADSLAKVRSFCNGGQCHML